MTTVLGLKHPKVESGILVADRQSTYLDERGMPSGKHLGRKLWKNKDDTACFGHSGFRDKELVEFMNNLSEGKYNIEKIISKGYFPELRKLNIKRMGNKLPDNNQLSGILMMARLENGPRLYTCFPFGAVEERVYTSIGSGSEKVLEYMNALNIIGEARDYEEEYNTKMEDIIRVGLEAVRRAQTQDLYSHGLDMIVLTPKGIEDHFADLGDNFGTILGKIQRKYTPKK